jgi:hypothetical protein
MMLIIPYPTNNKQNKLGLRTSLMILYRICRFKVDYLRTTEAVDFTVDGLDDVMRY